MLAINRLTNGWLSLGLGGAAAPRLTAGTAGSNPDTVIFWHKDKDQFRSLHDWLLTVVEQNHGQGIDPSTIEFEFETAAPTRLERMEAKVEQAHTAAAARNDEKMTATLGGERPDIVAAAARMDWLAEHLHEGEAVRFIAKGVYENTRASSCSLTFVCYSSSTA